MNKSRLEAFSDGVFAIVITLLILNIRLPEVDYDHLGEALIAILPNIFAYVMSFIVIGLYWVGHHNSFQMVAKINRGFLWLNILLLLWVSFMPFPTYLLGKYPFTPLPIIIYGLNLLAANITGVCMVLYVWYCPGLRSEMFTKTVFKKQLKSYLFINSVYIVAILVSSIAPRVSYYIFAAMIVSIIVLFGREIDSLYHRTKN